MRYLVSLSDLVPLRYQFITLKYSRVHHYPSVPEDGILQTPNNPDVEGGGESSWTPEPDAEEQQGTMDQTEDGDFEYGKPDCVRLHAERAISILSHQENNGDDVEDNDSRMSEGGRESRSVCEDTVTSVTSRSSTPLSEHLGYTADTITEWSKEELQKKYVGFDKIVQQAQLHLDELTAECTKTKEFEKFLITEVNDHGTHRSKLKLNLVQEKRLILEAREEVEDLKVQTKTFELNFKLHESRLKELEERNRMLQIQLEEAEKANARSSSRQGKITTLQQNNRQLCEQCHELQEHISGRSIAKVNALFDRSTDSRRIDSKTDLGTYRSCKNNGGIDQEDNVIIDCLELGPETRNKSRIVGQITDIREDTKVPKTSVKSIFKNMKKYLTKKSSPKESRKNRYNIGCFSRIRKLFLNKNRVIHFEEDF